MGLDITLTKCKNLAELKAREAAYEEDTKGVWESELSEEERDKRLEAAAAKHGTDKWGEAIGRESIEIDSTIEPDHLFKIGYFRSSYNGSGIESVMRKAGLPGLHDIFAVTGDDYEVTPDWKASLARADDAIVKYETFLRSDAGKYIAMELLPMHEYGVTSEAEALQLFVKEMANKRESFTSYSNRDGEFYLDGLTVRGFVTKKYERTDHPFDPILNRPTVYAIYDRPIEEGRKEDWHLTALRIVRETIEYVLQQPERESFYLRWSG